MGTSSSNSVAKSLLNGCDDSIRHDILIKTIRPSMATAHYLSWKNLPYTSDPWEVERWGFNVERFIENPGRPPCFYRPILSSLSALKPVDCKSSFFGIYPILILVSTSLAFFTDSHFLYCDRLIWKEIAKM